MMPDETKMIGNDPQIVRTRTASKRPTSGSPKRSVTALAATIPMS